MAVTNSKSKKMSMRLDGVHCICGKLLIQSTDASSLYNNSGARCDICGKQSRYKDTFWHCDQEETSIHPGGYDVCDSCNGNPCVGNITSCHHLKRLLIAMNIYKICDYEKTSQILDDYLHLIHSHIEDKDFEYVVNKFGYCEIDTCKMFIRNHRDRYNKSQTTKLD
eukprot:40243_1